MGRELRFDHLFSAFRTHLKPLIILSLLYIVAFVAIMIPTVIVLVGMLYFFGDVNGTNEALVNGRISMGMLTGMTGASIVGTLLLIPAIMAIWFAPALIVLHDIKPIQAMKMSIKGCVKNIFPFLTFIIVGFIVAILGVTLTLGLGFVVLIPVGMISYYTSYRDVWTDQPLSTT